MPATRRKQNRQKDGPRCACPLHALNDCTFEIPTFKSPELGDGQQRLDNLGSLYEGENRQNKYDTCATLRKHCTLPVEKGGHSIPPEELSKYPELAPFLPKRIAKHTPATKEGARRAKV